MARPSLGQTRPAWGIPNENCQERREPARRNPLLLPASVAVFYVLALGLTWGAWAPWIWRVRAGGALDGWRYLHLYGGLGAVAGQRKPADGVALRARRRLGAARRHAHAILDVYFLADMGVPVQSVMGAAVTIWGVVVAVHGLRRRPPRRDRLAEILL
jgi:hypothetical protein